MIQKIKACWNSYWQEYIERKELWKNPKLKILTKRDTSIVLYCVGLGLNEKKVQTLTWKSIVVFTETKRVNLIKYLKGVQKESRTLGKSIVEVMDSKIVDLGEDVHKILNKFKLSVKQNTVNVDVLDEFGTVVFRGLKENVQKYTSFIRKSETERKALIEAMYKRMRTKGGRYDLKKAIEKGYDDIPISKNGTSPDFDGLTHYLYKGDPEFGRVRIKVTGSRDKDFAQANQIMNLDTPPKGYTWHHLDDLDENLECTIQLVKSVVHKATYKHKGSAAQFQDLFNITEKYL